MEKGNAINMQGQPVAGGTAAGVGEGQAGASHFIPSENWRDGICDCFTFGCCHAMCCLGCWCQPILVGQVMTRMSRDIFGGPGDRPSVSSTCKIVTGIFVVVLIIQIALQIIMDTQHCWGGVQRMDSDTKETYVQCPDGTDEPVSGTYSTLSWITSIISFIFFIYIFIAVMRTRSEMRRKYNIPVKTCGLCEDCCCAWWCTCCTVQQMARHTNDYHNYDVGCCSNDCFSKRGQQDHLPEIDP